MQQRKKCAVVKRSTKRLTKFTPETPSQLNDIFVMKNIIVSSISQASLKLLDVCGIDLFYGQLISI